MKNSQKEKLKIGNLAKELGIEKFVVRFWEKEFGIAASRTKGGQRFYKKKDFEQFKKIKKLLYEEGFTIAGAKKILDEDKHNPEKKAAIISCDISLNNTQILESSIKNQSLIIQELTHIKNRLIDLKQKLHNHETV